MLKAINWFICIDCWHKIRKEKIILPPKKWKLEISEDFRKVLQGYLDNKDFEYVARRFMELLK